MPLLPAAPSELARLLRVVLAGDLAAIRGVLDELLEQSRPEDWRWLRERVGALAVSNYGGFAGDGDAPHRRRRFVAEAGEGHAMDERAWQAFAGDLAARFWLDLYDLDGTLAALGESLKRTRPFGFGGG